MKQVAISGPLGSTIATRSLRPMLSALICSRVVAISARKALKLKGKRDGAAIAGAGSAPQASKCCKTTDIHVSLILK